MWTEKQIVDVFLLVNSFSDVDKYPGCLYFLLAETNIAKMTGPYKKLLQLHLVRDFFTFGGFFIHKFILLIVLWCEF